MSASIVLADVHDAKTQYFVDKIGNLAFLSATRSAQEKHKPELARTRSLAIRI